MSLIILTPSVPVVVVPASQHRCFHCGTVLEGLDSLHFCSRCGSPQPIAPHEDYFSAFGVSRSFSQDTQELERRFYRFSRALHPDRFTSAGENLRDLSLKRMSFLNQAYNTLKNPEQRRVYLLELEKTPKAQEATEGAEKNRQSLPIELAEAWFELQEEATPEKITEFQQELEHLKQKSAETIARLERAYDEGQAVEGKGILKEIAQKIANEIQRASYIYSLSRDVERMKKNVNAAK